MLPQFSDISTEASSNETIATKTTLSNLTLVNDIFLGKWKEDQSKRQNLIDFLSYRGISWFKRKAAGNSKNWWLTMNIARNGNIYAFDGKSMYYYNIIYYFGQNIVEKIPFNLIFQKDIIWKNTNSRRLRTTIPNPTLT